MSFSKIFGGFLSVCFIFGAGWLTSIHFDELEKAFGAQTQNEVSGLLEQKRFVRDANKRQQILRDERLQKAEVAKERANHDSKGYFTFDETGRVTYVRTEEKKIWARHPGKLRSDAIGEIDADWSQLNLTYTRNSKTSAEIAAEFNEIEEALKRAAIAAELDGAVVKTITREIVANKAAQQRVSTSASNSAPERSGLFNGELLVTVIYPGSTRFNEFLTQDEVPPSFTASTPIHWFEDENDAAKPLKERALAKIYDRAREIYGPALIRLDNVTYGNSLDDIRGYKYKTTPIRVKISANASISLHNPN